MKTTFRAPKLYAEIIFSCAEDYKLKTQERPDKFIEKMKKNQGSIGMITGFGCDKDGL